MDNRKQKTDDSNIKCTCFRRFILHTLGGVCEGGGEGRFTFRAFPVVVFFRGLVVVGRVYSASCGLIHCILINYTS